MLLLLLLLHAAARIAAIDRVVHQNITHCHKYLIPTFYFMVVC